MPRLYHKGQELYALKSRHHNLTIAQAEGIKELIEKIMKYPKDTMFHLNTWTFGYEDVWVALSAAFDTKAYTIPYSLFTIF